MPTRRACDGAIAIGGDTPAESYWVFDKVLNAARQSGVQAIHPGYGFLSENPAFAAACEASGITFIGLSSQTIQAIGDKVAAKRLVSSIGVPVLQGYDADDQSIETLVNEAKRIGFPIMIKAAAGGGGHGIRLVHHPKELNDGLRSAVSEAKATFGDAVISGARADRAAPY